MKRILKISCFIFILFFFPISSHAMESIEEIQSSIDEKTELLNGRMGNLNQEIKELEDDIAVYGEDYTYNYKSYTNSIDSKNTESYTIKSSSFLTNDKKENKTVSEILEEKLEEKEKIDELFLQIEELQETIDNFQKITFDAEDVTKPSYLTVEEIEYILDGTKLEELAQDFYDAEQEHGVNAFFIISLAAWESGWGTSSRARNDNNLTGFGVYSDSSVGINSETKRDNIMLTTKTLKKNYLTEGGSCYHGLSVYDVSISYCKSDIWAPNVSRIGNELKEDLFSNFLNELNISFIY